MKFHRILSVLSAGLFLVSGLSLSAADFAPEPIETLECAVETSIRNGEIPGAVVWFEHDGKHYVKAFGQRQVQQPKKQ